jgi:plasmid maintenance system antidote protein VapI
MPTARTVSDQLRDAIRDCGLSVRELGKRADVDDGQIHRFLAGQRGLNLDTVDRLAATLDLRLMEALRRPGRRPMKARNPRTATE